MADILQMTFSNAFSLMKMFEFLSKFHWSLFLRDLVYIVNIGLGNGVMSNRHQAITWTNDDPFQLCIYASPTVFETQSKKL